MVFPFEETSSELLDNLKSIESLNQSCSYFNKKWALNIKDDLKHSFEDAIKEVEDETKKHLHGMKKCIVFGRTSAGKSSFINAILGSSILHFGNGTTTTGYVKVKRSPTKESFVMVNNERMSSTVLKELNRSGSSSVYHADLLYDESKWPFYDDHIEIIDTPGINENPLIDENINRFCKDGHLVILVVDSTGSLDMTLKTFISSVKTKYVNLHICIVFNKWDMIRDHETKDVRNEHFNCAKQVLCDTLEYSIEEINNRIFFLSSERNWANLDTLREYGDFDNLIIKIKKEMEDRKRKIGFLKETNIQIIAETKLSLETMSRMKIKIENIQKLSGERRKKLNFVKEKILAQISKICEQCFAKLNEEFLDVIKFKLKNVKLTKEDVTKIAEEVKKQKNKKKDIVDNNQSNYDFMLPFVDEGTIKKILSLTQSSKNGAEQISIEDKKNLLIWFVEKSLKETIFEQIIDHLKTEFTKLVNNQKDEYMTDQLKLFNFEYNPQENEENIVSFVPLCLENILNIKAAKLTKEIKIIAGVTTGLSVAAVAATGGIAAAIIAPIQFAVASMVGIGVASAAGGAALGGGIAVGIVHVAGIDWEQKLAESEKNVKEKIEAFENYLCDKYTKYFDDCSQDLAKPFKDLEEKFNSVKTNLDIIGLKINEMRGNV